MPAWAKTLDEWTNAKVSPKESKPATYHVYGIPEKLESTLFTSKDSSGNGTRMKSDTESKLRSIGPEPDFHHPCDGVHTFQRTLGKLDLNVLIRLDGEKKLHCAV